MNCVDNDFVLEVVERLSKIEPDASPKWGKMKGADVVPHLIQTLKYSMGRYGALPVTGTWFHQKILRPLLLNELLPLPKNLRSPDYGNGDAEENGDLESLHALLEEYLIQVQSGALEPPPHPKLGDIGIDGWAQLHYVHFRHHLKQFGV